MQVTIVKNGYLLRWQCDTCNASGDGIEEMMNHWNQTRHDWFSNLGDQSTRAVTVNNVWTRSVG